MRLKAELILDFEVDDKQPQNGIVREYRRQYKAMSEILDKRPEILAVVHRDLQSLGSTKSQRGRKADFTTENLFRAILVMQREGLDYREASVRIAESHIEMIMRGRREKPVEFGHKVLLTQSREKFITDYVVFEKSKSDKKLLPMVLQRHEQMYGVRPESVAGDNGFCPDDETYEELAETVGYLGVPRRMSDFGDDMMRIWQHWRAGIEGTISCLKRAFRLARCCFRGFKNFASAVGSAVFCHNLTILAKAPDG